MFDNCRVCILEQKRPRRMTCSDACHDRWIDHSPRYWAVRFYVNMLFWSSVATLAFLAMLWITAALVNILFMVLPWALLVLIGLGVWGIIKSVRSK